uniref:Uncharacterized protein n=1 Tax=Spongospora subterranea TaxID=70186 RepID=A0A0H5QU93_9EUKA|eukprot:CRZ05282.1 hypothetical protein [Spongospora subterranea]
MPLDLYNMELRVKNRKPLARSSHNAPDIQSLVFKEMNCQIFISFSSTTWHIFQKVIFVPFPCWVSSMFFFAASLTSIVFFVVGRIGLIHSSRYSYVYSCH